MCFTRMVQIGDSKLNSLFTNMYVGRTYQWRKYKKKLLSAIFGKTYRISNHAVVIFADDFGVNGANHR